MRKRSTHTARANSTILMHRLCRGFPTAHSRATVSSIHSRKLTSQAAKVARDNYSSMPEPRKHQHCRVHVAKMVSADTLVAPSRQPLWPAATTACRRARASSGRSEVRVHPSKSEPCSSGDESAPQACGSHSPPPKAPCAARRRWQLVSCRCSPARGCTRAAEPAARVMASARPRTSLPARETHHGRPIVGARRHRSDDDTNSKSSRPIFNELWPPPDAEPLGPRGRASGERCPGMGPRGGPSAVGHRQSSKVAPQWG